MKIVFFGSPEFAVPTLIELTRKHRVSLVVTQPDRPKGRGRKLQPTPIKSEAIRLNTPVISPKAIKTDKFFNRLKEENADYFVVSAYGRILPDRILNLPKYGCLNIHPSLLPLFRGPAPVNWTLIKGHKITGVSIIKMNSEMDAGDIVTIQKTAIHPNESAGELLHRLSLMGTSQLLSILEQEEIFKFNLPVMPQDHSLATYAPFLDSKTGNINWNLSSEEISGFIRGLDPKPGAFSYLNGKRIKLFKPLLCDLSGKPGKIIGIDKNGVIIACGKNSLIIREMLFPGKKRLETKSLIAGRLLNVGDSFISEK